MTLPGDPEPIVRLSSRAVYANPWIEVREDVVRFPDGHEGIYGVVTGKPATGVLPFVDADHVLLVRQHRYVIGRATWEMPTGGALPGETLEDAVQRELAEETGHRAGRLVHLHSHCTSKSVLDEWAHLYLAEDLEPADAERDPTEFLQVRAFPFDEVLAMVLRSEIVDAMTVIAVLLADRRRSPGP